VCLIACNAQGQCDTLCRTVEVKTVGTNSLQLSDPFTVRLFPNPANDILSIQTEMLALPAQAIIWDALGRQVLSQPLYAAATTLSIRQLPDGLYLVSVTDKTGRRVLQKLIVQQD
jgi:hypothetical protein